MSGNVLLLIVPIVAITVGKTAEIILKKYFTGELLYIIGRAVYVLGWWMAAFFFFYLLPEAPAINLASYGILVLALASTAARCMALIKKRMVLYSILQALIYLIQGIAVRGMIVTLWPGGAWELGVRVSVADMALWGYITISACALLRMLELSESDYIKQTGRWFSAAKGLKFLFTCFAVFIFKDLWQHMEKLFPGNVPLARWIFVFLLLLAVMLIVNSKVRRHVKASYSANLQRHTQNVTFLKGSELPEVSGLVGDFIEKGDKTGILTYMVVMAHELGIPRIITSRIMKSLIEYRDMQSPPFAWRRERKAIERDNREKRNALLNKTIEQIRYYGRKTDEE